MNATTTIQAIIDALNRVTVSGHENMNLLLGSMQTLLKLKRELEGQEARVNNAEPSAPAPV